ncbi:hypothetical protein LBMAG25_13010 [Bacteroidota bacterium]|nr:hypothetical protein LBMAG25_13010 [Bacteroidota bacterium]
MAPIPNSTNADAESVRFKPFSDSEASANKSGNGFLENNDIWEGVVFGYQNNGNEINDWN